MPKKYWYINTSNMLLECKNNHNQIIFRGVNDEKQREKLKSITFKRGKLTDVWVEEATEITQSDFEIIDDRLRGILPKGLFYQIRLSGILADIKKICRSIEHTAHYAWNMQRPTQRILPDNTTKQPLLMGILEVAFKFS